KSQGRLVQASRPLYDSVTRNAVEADARFGRMTSKPEVNFPSRKADQMRLTTPGFAIPTLRLPASFAMDDGQADSQPTLLPREGVTCRDVSGLKSFLEPLRA